MFFAFGRLCGQTHQVSPRSPAIIRQNVLTLYGSRNVKIAEACAVKTYRTPSRKASESINVVSRYGIDNEQEFDRAKEYTNFPSLPFQNSIMPESSHKKHHSSHGHGHGHKLENKQTQTFQGDGGQSTANMKTKRQGIAGSGFGAVAIVFSIEQCQPSSNNVQGMTAFVVSMAYGEQVDKL
jgi:hypothetical protein